MPDRYLPLYEFNDLHNSLMDSIKVIIEALNSFILEDQDPKTARYLSLIRAVVDIIIRVKEKHLLAQGGCFFRTTVFIIEINQIVEVAHSLSDMLTIYLANPEEIQEPFYFKRLPRISNRA